MVLSDTDMLVDLSVTIMQVSVFVAIMQLEISTAFMQVTVSTANMWLTIFTVIMQMGVCSNCAGGIFAVHYAHDCFYCNCTGNSFFYSYVGGGFK